MNFDSVLIRVMADWLMLPVILISVIALLIKVPNKLKISTYSRLLIAGLITYMLAKFVGYIFQPSIQRPFEALGLQAGASFLNNPGFPSDHILFASAIVFAVWFTTKNKLIILILIILVILMAIGRVLAFVHTPLDVIGGVLFSLIGSLWYLNDKNLIA